MNSVVFDIPFLIIAHRVARSVSPENTLASARKALDAGAHMWEIDVVMTRGGVPVALHDFTLERTSNVKEVAGVENEKTRISSFRVGCQSRRGNGPTHRAGSPRSFHGLSPRTGAGAQGT